MYSKHKKLLDDNYQGIEFLGQFNCDRTAQVILTK